jgi:Rad3-related DNA helicase
MEQLGGKKDEDYAVYAPSSFLPENRLIMIGNDVSTKYTRRNETEYKRILQYILDFTGARTGNYMVFFPSYQMLQAVAELAGDQIEGLVVQNSSMTEEEKELFLEEFIDDPEVSRVGFCVMGGIFSEGIDLKNDRLIGAVIVGTGLPMVWNERELFRGYFDEKNGKGFDYAYLYQGMNKVMQSAGRVIRTK